MFATILFSAIYLVRRTGLNSTLYVVKLYSFPHHAINCICISHFQLNAYFLWRKNFHNIYIFFTIFLILRTAGAYTHAPMTVFAHSSVL